MNKLILLMCLLPFLAYAQNKDLEADKYLLARVIDLERQIDSLKQVNENNILKYKASEHQEVINKVNDFYDSAWSKLIFWLVPLSVLVPFIIQWMQQRNFKNTEERILNQLENTFKQNLEQLEEQSKIEVLGINAKFEQLSNQNNEEISNLNTLIGEKTQDLQNEYIRITNSIKANVYTTIAVIFEDKDEHLFSTINFIAACQFKVMTDNELAAISNLESAIRCLKDAKEPSLDELNKYCKQMTEYENIDDFLDSFKSYQLTDKLLDKIGSVKDVVKEIFKH